MANTNSYLIKTQRTFSELFETAFVCLFEQKPFHPLWHVYKNTIIALVARSVSHLKNTYASKICIGLFLPSIILTGLIPFLSESGLLRKKKKERTNLDFFKIW